MKPKAPQVRLIIHAAPDNLVFGVRAARWLTSLGPDQKDGVVSYGSDACDTVDIYVKRNKSGSITAREVKRAS
jgi:hypothetical protein